MAYAITANGTETRYRTKPHADAAARTIHETTGAIVGIYIPEPAPRCPSVATLQRIADVTRDDARAIREIMRGPGKVGGLTRMQRIDRILRTCGVEYVPRGRGRRSPAFHYCNTGDTYAPTVCKIGGRFVVCSWGTFVERGDYA